MSVHIDERLLIRSAEVQGENLVLKNLRICKVAYLAAQERKGGRNGGKSGGVWGGAL